MSAESDFLLGTVRALVSKPESVSVIESIEEDSIELHVTVDPSDISILIGRGGRTAGALRILSRAIGAVHGRKVRLTIVEPTNISPHAL